MRQVAAEDIAQARGASGSACSRPRRCCPAGAGSRWPAPSCCSWRSPRALAGAQPRPRAAVGRGRSAGRPAPGIAADSSGRRQPRSPAALPGAGRGRRSPPARGGAGERAPGPRCREKTVRPAAGERAALPARRGAQRRGGRPGAGEPDPAPRHGRLGHPHPSSPPSTYPSYRASLRDAGGKEIWQARGLRPDSRDTLVLLLPASMLPPGVYQLTIEGEGKGGVVGAYPFRVVRP